MQKAPFAHPSTGAPPSGYTTKEFGIIVRSEPHTIRVSLCEKGHYLGVRPVKLPNRRLLWPAAEVDAVARGQSVPATTPVPATTAERPEPRPRTRRRAAGWIETAEGGVE